MFQMENQPKIQLYPLSETSLFGEIPDIQIHFLCDKQNHVSQINLFQDGEKSTGLRDFIP